MRKKRRMSVVPKKEALGRPVQQTVRIYETYLREILRLKKTKNRRSISEIVNLLIKYGLEEERKRSGDGDVE